MSDSGRFPEKTHSLREWLEIKKKQYCLRGNVSLKQMQSEACSHLSMFSCF